MLSAVRSSSGDRQCVQAHLLRSARHTPSSFQKPAAIVFDEIPDDPVDRLCEILGRSGPREAPEVRISAHRGRHFRLIVDGISA